MTKGLIYVTILIILLGSCQQSSEREKDTSSSSTDSVTAQQVKDHAPTPVILVMKNGYYGFADTAGNWIISAQYGHALPFSNGVSCVNVQGVDTFSIDEPHYRFMNFSGKLVLPSIQFPIPSFFYNGVGQVHLDNGAFIQFNLEGKPLNSQVKGAALFHEGLAASQHPITMKVGFMNKSGHWVFQLENAQSVGDFSQGLAKIQQEDEFGYMNTSGEIVIPLQYEKAHDFSENLAAIQKGGLWGFIGLDGNEVIPPRYVWVSDFKEGVAAVKTTRENGYINSNGDWLFPPSKLIAEVIHPFSEGKAAVKVNGKWGFINRKGLLVIPPRFEAVTPFQFGRAIAIDGREAICIDQNGNTIQLDGTPMSGFHHPDSSNIPYPLFEQ